MPHCHEGMLDRMEALSLTQKALVERFQGCSQQYISRVLKGTENLSIESISKIEAALKWIFFRAPDGWPLTNS